MIGFITKVRSFGALARYLQTGTDGPSGRRVLWTRAQYVSNDLQKAATEMNLTGRFTDTDSLGYHLTIGYDPTDRPTRAEMEYAVERTLSALGLEENMAITAAHGDAYFAHTHTMVARWDYWTGRLVEASNSYYVITGKMRELEQELGMEPAPRPLWERDGHKSGERERTESRPNPLARRFPNAARNGARSALRKATSWPDLRRLLQKEGLRFQRGRDNLLIGKGEATLRAGQIMGGTSLAKLEARFGQTLHDHEAEMAQHLMGAAGGAAPQEAAKTRSDTREDPTTSRDTRSGRDRDTDVGSTENILLALAKALGQREEAYQLTRRSALLEAEEADVTELYQDLRQLEVRGTVLLEDLLQKESFRTGVSPSRQGVTRNGRFEEGDRSEEGSRLETEARNLWRAAALGVERRVSRATASNGLAGPLVEPALDEALSERLSGSVQTGRASPGRRLDEEKRPAEASQLHALLEGHRGAVRKAWELFGEAPWSDRIRGSAGTVTKPETEKHSTASSLSADSASDPSGREGRTDVPACRSAKRLLRETREAIREVRAEIEGRLSELQEQAREGKGPSQLERELQRALGQLVEDNPGAVSRLARTYLDGEEEGLEERSPQERELLLSRSVQEALRRALPEGHRIESGIEGKTANRSR